MSRFHVWAGLAVLLLIAFFLSRGLEDADRFASVIGLLFMIAMQAHTLTKAQRPEASDTAAEAPRRQRGRHRQRISKPAAIVITVSLGAFSCNVAGPSGSGNRNSPYQCGIAAGTPGTIAPRPALAGGMVFCPVQVDDGTGPIEGPFVLTGQVVGRHPEDLELVLFVRVDPATCDTEGERGRRGRYLLEQVDLHAADSGWSYLDDLGDHPPGVTFGRIFEYATMSPQSLRAMRGRGRAFGSGDIGDYELPPDVRFLSRFEVPPGVAAERVPCD
ncbi:hypothetical protein [Actinoplanes sp. NPDC049118]|uniref:hypothetical protein n=1 Tax=Actinoplanes sp. NPDC049118 TaxID=3155769 RepID=UPI0033E7AE30